jgi:hypothetical protein
MDFAICGLLKKGLLATKNSFPLFEKPATIHKYQFGRYWNRSSWDMYRPGFLFTHSLVEEVLIRCCFNYPCFSYDGVGMLKRTFCTVLKGVKGAMFVYVFDDTRGSDW